MIGYTQYSWMTEDEVVSVALSREGRTEMEVELCARLVSLMAELEDKTLEDEEIREILASCKPQTSGVN